MKSIASLLSAILLSAALVTVVACSDPEEVNYSGNNATNNGANNATNNGGNNATNNGGNNATNNRSNNGTDCDGHAIGESWSLDCNSCTCTADGIACTGAVCPNACDELEADYAAAIETNAACSANADCQILSGQCGIGLGGCYVSANDGLTQETLNALGQQFGAAGCTNGVCDCAPPPPPGCIDGRCGFLPLCGDHDFGEQWDVDCNVCECTFDGVVCTTAECGGCGDHQLGDEWLGNDGCNTCTCTADGPACTDRACDVCTGIETRYLDTVAQSKSCNTGADCQVVYGHCGIGVGGCHYAVNASFDATALDALAAEFTDNNCSGPVCRCVVPPPVDCVEGACAFVDATSPCPGHAVGETWIDTDGCNACTCTADGPACTDRACASCDGIAAQYAAAVAETYTCQSDDQCMVVPGDCGISLGGCYYFSTADLAARLQPLVSQWQQQGCGEGLPVCDCAAPPDQLACVDGACTPL